MFRSTALMAQWILRLSSEQKILGSSPGEGFLPPILIPPLG